MLGFTWVGRAWSGEGRIGRYRVSTIRIVVYLHTNHTLNPKLLNPSTAPNP